MADHLYIRYLEPDWPGTWAGAEVLWVEYKRKRPGKTIFTKAEKAKIHQEAWIAAERARGALVWLAGVDFPASIEGFQEHYRKSGLRRKVR